MEPFSKRHCSFMYALADYYVKQFRRIAVCSSMNLVANWYRYLPRVAARLRMSMEKSAHRDKTMPTGEMNRRFGAHQSTTKARVQGILSRFLKGSAKRF